jgi:hypothetical protein
MDVKLSDDDAQTLLGFLRDSLPGLKFEAARTRGSDDLLHVLLARVSLCERLIGELSGSLTDARSRP